MSLPVECGPHGEGKRSLRQSFQTATHHLLEMRGTEDVHRVGASATTYDLAPSKSNDRRQSARGDDHQPRVPKSYKYCGKLHEFKKELCPAYNTRCKKCDKLHHFARMCNSAENGSYRSSRQECKLVHSDDESDTENIFVIHSNKPQQNKEKLFARLKVGENLVRFQIYCAATVNVISDD